MAKKAKNTLPTILVGVDAVAESLGVSEATIWRWVRETDTFPRPLRLSPGCTRWKQADLDLWLSELAA